MSNPLDIAHGFGKDDWMMELAEELHDLDDPLGIMTRCEQIDEDEGWQAGTALRLYFVYWKLAR